MRRGHSPTMWPHLLISLSLRHFRGTESSYWALATFTQTTSTQKKSIHCEILFVLFLMDDSSQISFSAFYWSQHLWWCFEASPWGRILTPRWYSTTVLLLYYCCVLLLCTTLLIRALWVFMSMSLSNVNYSIFIIFFVISAFFSPLSPQCSFLMGTIGRKSASTWVWTCSTRTVRWNDWTETDASTELHLKKIQQKNAFFVVFVECLWLYCFSSLFITLSLSRSVFVHAQNTHIEMINSVQNNALVTFFVLFCA